MEIREEMELREKEHLSPYAFLSMNSKGRQHREQHCDIRTDFQRDRDRIVHSKAFRRLKHKTQVFIAPEGDHYRTRLTHTLEVAQVSRAAARALHLNEDLAEAIALGHDLGHTPFGHAGETCLNELSPGGFKHNEQSIRVVDFLEQGKGLNLTLEVRDGILRHTGDEKPVTLEGQIVKISDRIAYINHDIDDALRAGILRESDLPREEIARLGKNSSERLNTLIRDMILNNRHCSQITLSEEIQEVLDSLRRFMFQTVYIGSLAKSEEDKVKHVMQALYEYLLSNPGYLATEEQGVHKDCSVEKAVCDYIAGMTDKFIINLYEKIFIPRPWKN